MTNEGTPMSKQSRAGFTLVEALTSIIVIAAVSTASWYAVDSLWRSGKHSSSRNIAVNLLQKSQEEIRKSALTYFDTLTTCQFPGAHFASGNNACGLSSITSTFPGYSRKLTTELVLGSTELKKVTIEVFWTEFGKNMSLSSAVLLARPPEPLRGNIRGTVRDQVSGSLIGGVTITVTFVSSASTPSLDSRRATSQAELFSGTDWNYDFANEGRFDLKVGRWNLTATHPSYFNQTVSNIEVVSGQPTTVNFTMEPRPADAELHVHLVDMTAGNSPLPSYNGGRVYVNDNGQAPTGIKWKLSETVAHLQNYSGNLVNSVFIIPFNRVEPKTLTVDTYFSYKAATGYAYPTAAGAGVGPSCRFNFNRDGWSSSYVRDERGTLECSNTHAGNSASDRIDINSGEVKHITVPLHPIPKATIRGRVVDSAGAPVKGATIFVYWPDSAQWLGTTQVTTNDSGEYTYVVPATQEMFDNSPGNYLKVKARGSVPVPGCCNSTTFVTRDSTETINAPALYDGLTATLRDLVIPNADTVICGDLQGVISDDLSGGGVNGAMVSVVNVAANTNAAGQYLYQCTGYKLPSGAQAVSITKSGYYDFLSAGNLWYAATAPADIRASQMNDYSARIWPRGPAVIEVRVKDAGTQEAVSGATVTFTPYSSSIGSTQTLTTDSSGIARFNTLETWPPPSLTSTSRYNLTPRNHTVKVTHSSYTNIDTQTVTGVLSGDTKVVNSTLIPRSGL